MSQREQLEQESRLDARPCRVTCGGSCLASTCGRPFIGLRACPSIGSGSVAN